MSETLKIAIADDEPAILEDLRETLQELGHHVVAATRTGTELVKACRKTSPDLVITDIRMPEMDGLAATTRIYEGGAVPVIIASARSDAEYIEEVSEDHVLAYLVKPITNEALSAAIGLAMRRFRELQGLRPQSETRSATRTT